MSNDCQSINGIVVSLKANYLFVRPDLSELNLSISQKHKSSKSFCLLCTRRNKLNHRGLLVNVGDRVEVEAIDWNQATGVVSHIQPRKSFLNRPSVANVTETVVIIAVAQPSLDFDQVSRFLLTAEQIRLKVSLVLNKIDLIESNLLQEYVKRFQSWGYQPSLVSAKNGQGIEALRSKLQTTQLAVLCGPSGVGKSSLINFLLPKEKVPVNPVSGKLKRGRHTTRHVELFSIGDNSFVADTPGFNRPEIQIEPNNLASLFPELRVQLREFPCKFRNCLHKDEPGCGVSRSWDRYSHYRDLLEETIHSLR